MPFAIPVAPMVQSPGSAGINTAQLPFALAPTQSRAAIPAVYGTQLNLSRYGSSVASGRASVPTTRFW